jgi:hypothetical protein
MSSETYAQRFKGTITGTKSSGTENIQVYYEVIKADPVTGEYTCKLCNDNYPGGTAYYYSSITIPDYVTYNNDDYIVTVLEGEEDGSGNYGPIPAGTYTEKVTLPLYLEEIGQSVFVNRNTSLNEVSGSKNLRIIRKWAFSGARKLKTIDLSKVEDIGDHAFKGTDSLKEAFLPNIKQLGREAFRNSYSNGLQKVTLGDKLTKIPNRCFMGQTKLKTVTLGSSIIEIGDSAFYNCNTLNSVTVGFSTPPIITSNTFSNRAYATLYVPAGSKAAFMAKSYWNEFKNIVEIINFADANVKALCVANWDTNGDGKLYPTEAAAVTDLGTVFKWNTNITSFNELKYFTGLTSISNYTFHACTNLLSVTIPENVTSIGNYAFYNSYALENIIVASNNTTFDSRDNCNAIIKTTTNELILGCKNTIIPNNVSKIGSYAFCNCSGLTSITIPNSVTSIGSSAFSGCNSLTSISIPSRVTTIGSSAFYSCSSLENIVVESNNTTYDSRDNCNAIIKTATNELIKGCKNTIIPNNVASIASNAFYRCLGLTSITIPNSVTSIGNSAFSGCSDLTSITVDIATPLTITSTTFTSCENATLYVPYGSKALYEAADYWKEFKEIIEMEEEVNNEAQDPVGRTRPVPVAQTKFNLNTTYYLYNVGRGMFVNKGEAWGTQAILSHQGMRYEVRHNDDMPEGYYYLYSEETGMDNKVLFRTNTDELLGEGVCATFVDKWTAANAYWTINPFNDNVTGGFVFKIPENTDGPHPYVATQAWGARWDHWGSTFNSEGLTNGIFFDVNIDYNPDYVTWQFISEDDYANYQSRLNTDAVETWNAAADLKEWSDIAKLRGENVASTEALYNNVSSSVSDLRAAIEELRPFIVSLRDALSRLQNAISQATISGIDVTAAQAVLDSSTATIAEINAAIEALNAQMSSTTKGDANGDGAVNVTDYLAVANYILGTNTANFNETAADVNTDGTVNVSDYVGVANIVLYGNYQGPSANAIMALNAENTSTWLEMKQMEDGKVSILLHNAKSFSAFQMDIQLPDGVEIVEAYMAKASQSKHLGYAKLENGTWRLLYGTLENKAVMLSDDNLLTLELAGNNANIGGNMTIDQIFLVDRNTSTWQLSAVHGGLPTGITDIENASAIDGECYDLTGRKVDNSLLKKGVYVVNGKKMLVK